MATLLLIISVSSLLWPFQVSSLPVPSLSKRSSLSVEKSEDVMVSPNGMFSAGFLAVGVNAYSFAIWFTEPPGQNQNQKPTIVWMANRDQPVNGKRSTLSLDARGNLILTDAGQFNVWATNTSSPSSVELHLEDTGDLVLKEIMVGGSKILWQSFDFPTNTLLPHQSFTRRTSLVSSRSETNHSSGFYKLFFNNDNIIRLLYDNGDISSGYWPDPWLMPVQLKRSTYNASRIAVLDSLGNFTSSDNFTFITSDHGTVLQRRFIVDHDGNLRVYSRKDATEKWYVSWQAQMNPCRIHGVCGPNSICTIDPGSGSKCSCVPGYRLKNVKDLSQGCEQTYNISCTTSESYSFVQLSHVDFYGYDIGNFLGITFEECSKKCLESCYCIGFQYSFNKGDGHFNCYPKTMLLNGCHSPAFEGAFYLKLPNVNSSSYESFIEESSTHCSNETREVERMYVKDHENGKVKLMLWFAVGIGGIEVICILVVWGFLIRSGQQSGKNAQGYLPLGTGFRSYTYSELKKATQGKSQMMMGIQNKDGGEVGNWRLVTWMRAEKTRASADASWLKEIIDPMIEGDFDLYKMQALVEVALQCVEEDRDARPTMKQVVEMLQTYEND
ncbi:hypothetical protein L6164_020891 [Bauhinia variegata]|uniref:Uncharacterized protein n=1 Tax=Bauhinia variegata TaxID=167791 RepID=A0ACB9MY43_BAUVA|nr:hypothetical protein L6164_020891 [Bauhinia variegata]